MAAIHQRVRKTILRHALLPRGSRVLVGLSGGSDSVALALLLVELAEAGGFTVAGLVHVNHGLRETAGRDEAFCAALASKLGLSLVVRACDVRGVAAAARFSLEDAARRERYRCLEAAATEFGADRIAVGHTQDDQAETFLLKLMRGAGLSGLAGVYPRKGRVIRPLLDVSRADLRSYLAARQQAWMEDETNDDVANPRNRIRHRAIPELDLALGGQSRPNLARAAWLAREDTEWLDQQAAEQYAAVVSDLDGGLALDAALLTALPAPLGRRVALWALRRVVQGREVTQEHVEALLGVAGGHARGADVPGGRVELRGEKAVLIEQKPTPK